MDEDLQRLTDELPEGWSWTASRPAPDEPRLYGAYSAHQDLSTRPSYDVGEVIEEAHQLQADAAGPTEPCPDCGAEDWDEAPDGERHVCRACLSTWRWNSDTSLFYGQQIALEL